MAISETLIFRASLGLEVYRDTEVADTSSLYALAEAIVESFDFDFDHAFGFYSKLKGNYHDSPIQYELFADIGESTGMSHSVKRTRAVHAFPSVGSKMRLLFDYGDEWEFLVELVKRKPREPKVRLPRVLISAGKAPEQYHYAEEDGDGDNLDTAKPPLTNLLPRSRRATAAHDEEKIDSAVLGLLYLGLHQADRAWKGFDWAALDRLHQKGMISNPRSKAKSVEFTEAGLLRSEELFETMFTKKR